MLWIGVPLALATVPPIAAILIGATFWRGVVFFWPKLQPPSWMVGLLGLAAAFLLLPRHGLTVESAFGFLLVASSGKVLEWRHERDERVLWGLLWYLLAGRFLFETSLLAALHALIGFLGLVALRWSPWLKGQFLVLTTITLLLGTALFLVLPRPSKPLWSLPLRQEPKTGLSNHLAPGSVARLVASKALAFRVDFLGPPPPKPYYFRAQVFWRFDGQTWHLGPRKHISPTPATDKTIRYRLTVEPHDRKWLFVLGSATTRPAGTELLAGGVLESSTGLSSRKVFLIESLPDEIPLLLPEELKWGLQLPAPLSPRVRQLVEQLKQASGGHVEKLIAELLTFFHKGGFRYTTEPRPIRGDFIEGFLFETREGFCEHFASAFAFLLRAAGVPARVVGGYLGGTKNPYGDFLEVYQSNAHAWVEVWDGRTWLRIDPTTVVAPDYLETLEVAPLLRQQQVGQKGSVTGWAWLLWRIKSLWSLADYRWQLLVVQFDREQQFKLWQRLWNHLPSLALGLGVLALPLWQGTRFWWRHRDPLGYWFARFERKLGMKRRPTETVSDFCHRAAERFPEEAEEIEQIGWLYLQLRYGRGENITALTMRIRKLKLSSVRRYGG